MGTVPGRLSVCHTTCIELLSMKTAHMPELSSSSKIPAGRIYSFPLYFKLFATSSAVSQGEEFGFWFTANNDNNKNKR